MDWFKGLTPSTLEKMMVIMSIFVLMMYSKINDSETQLCRSRANLLMLDKNPIALLEDTQCNG